MARRFNPAPGWPVPPPGWTPPPGWKPDPSWPPAPAGWRFWVDDASPPATPPVAPGQPPPAGRSAPAGPHPAGPQAAGYPTAGPQGPAPVGARYAGAESGPVTDTGWEPPEPAGPGFSAWVRDHKLVAGAVVVLAVLLLLLLSLWISGGSGDQEGAGRDDAGNGTDRGPRAGDDQPGSLTPSDDFASATEKLTAAINAALIAPLPPRLGATPTVPTGPAGTPGSSPPPSGPATGGPSGSATETPPGAGIGSPGVRVEALGRDGTPIFVRWSIDATLTGTALKDAARVDAIKILTAVKSTADFAYSRVVLIGSHPVTAAGASQQQVVEATYSKATLDRVNLDALEARRVFEISDSVALDSALRY